MTLFFTKGGRRPAAGHTQLSQVKPTAGGPRQSLTSELRLISQEAHC